MMCLGCGGQQHKSVSQATDTSVCVYVCVCMCVCAPPDVCSLQSNHSRSLTRSLQARNSSEGCFLMHTLLFLMHTLLFLMHTLLFLMHTLLYVIVLYISYLLLLPPLCSSLTAPVPHLPGRVSMFLPLSSGVAWRLTLCPLNSASSLHITQRRQRTRTPLLPYWNNTRSDTHTHILIHSYSHSHFQEGPDWIHHEDWILLKV